MIDELMKELNKGDELPDDRRPKQPTQMREVFGLFQTVNTVPTQAPNNWHNQIQIYQSGATLRLYWWDNNNQAWHYVTATA